MVVFINEKKIIWKTRKITRLYVTLPVKFGILFSKTFEKLRYLAKFKKMLRRQILSFITIFICLCFFKRQKFYQK